MTKEKENNTVKLTVDGREVTAQLHEPVLGVAARIGINIPSICDHPDLEPLGACRLCLVEVTKNGRTKTVTSCNYPAEDGIEVKTSTDKIIKHRAMVAETMLAMCPDVPAIKELAAGMGVEKSRLGTGDSTCILCGLCTRVCDTFATSAIALLNRGENRKVGAPVGDVAEDCVGCGACSQICPTGHIELKRETGKLSIWGKDFPLAVCTVDDGKCISCGMCEEACPFSIPRVSFKKDGRSAATIDVNACKGCGVCLSACPCGAIEQPRAKRDLPVANTDSAKVRTLVVACARSGLERSASQPMPKGSTLLELPCAGSVNPALLLGALASGYDGVLVLGRHEETCRLNGAEKHGRNVVAQVDKLAGLVGLGHGRLDFVEPGPGPEGPVAAIESFFQELKPLGLKETLPAEITLKSHGDAATIISWLIENTDGTSRSSLTEIQAQFENALPFRPTYRTQNSSKWSAYKFPTQKQEETISSLGGLRIASHPILDPIPGREVEFTFNGQTLMARENEMIASALFANGISVFGHHHRDGGGQGIFCANGQCSQCTVLADGKMVKSCMVEVTPGLEVTSCEGLPPLMADDKLPELGTPSETQVPVLILGGGPAGLCAAIELGKVGITVLVVDDKPDLGGKLTLQTHGFFGSVADCYAGTRGIDIGRNLAAEAAALPTVEIWTNATALGLFWDGKVGVSTKTGYRLVAPENLLIAMGAREKALSFPGCDLPGIYGAGAFQTLVNRDLVSASKKLFILGGGNVGLIGAYHALQANIDVVGLVEALPQCGGYKVHADKIKRLGVPIWTGHTVVKASGEKHLETVTIAKIDKNFQPISGTEQTFEADTLLIAVGLASVDEILEKAREYGIKVWAAGDSDEVAEASAAIFSGRIVGRKLARDLGVKVEIPDHWEPLAAILRSRPGKTVEWKPKAEDRHVYPMIRCVQEIPCNPCVAACPEGLISMEGGIMNLPEFEGDCLGCGNCVARCPGLAINLVQEDYDKNKKTALVTVPFEFRGEDVPMGETVNTVDFDGNEIGTGKVIAARERKDQDRRWLLSVEVPWDERLNVAGFTIRGPSIPIETILAEDDEDPIVCRCERIKKSDIVNEIRAGVRDINQLKALARPSMGGCGGKTCTELVKRIFREEGVSLDEVTSGTIRPLIAEAPLGTFVQKESSND